MVNHPQINEIIDLKIGLWPLKDAPVKTDYQYQTAAQVTDQRTAVGLARTPQVDLRFFLRTPSLPDLEDVSIELFQTKQDSLYM